MVPHSTVGEYLLPRLFFQVVGALFLSLGVTCFIIVFIEPWDNIFSKGS